MSALSAEQKDILNSFLLSGKKMSSNQKCRKIVEDYGKESYYSTSSKQILKESYSLRSAYAHGNNCREEYNSAVDKMKYLVLDVIINYFHEREVYNA